MKSNYKYNILCECLANQANYDVIIKENISKLGFFLIMGNLVINLDLVSINT